MQRSLGGGPRADGEEFFEKRRDRFIEKMADMGMDVMDLKDFIEDKGLVEENPEIIIDNLNNPAYINPLK